jgi:hypothetical protein
MTTLFLMTALLACMGEDVATANAYYADFEAKTQLFFHWEEVEPEAGEDEARVSGEGLLLLLEEEWTCDTARDAFIEDESVTWFWGVDAARALGEGSGLILSLFFDQLVPLGHEIDDDIWDGIWSDNVGEVPDEDADGWLSKNAIAWWQDQDLLIYDNCGLLLDIQPSEDGGRSGTWVHHWGSDDFRALDCGDPGVE